MDLRLVGIQGAKIGQIVALSGVDVTIGREPNNTLSFPGDSQVSRYHARISGGFIQDLGSTNGTLVNGVRIGGPTALNASDLVQFGGHQFRVEAPMAAAPRPAEVPGAQRPRPKERGSIESLYPKTAGPMTPPGNGCAMPNIDLSGCARVLLILLIMLLIGLVIAAIWMAIGMGIGAMSAASHSQGSHPGHSTPQSPGQDQPQQNPPPADDQQQNQQQGILVISVKIDYDRRDGTTIQPVVLVKWRNQTQEPVSRLIGTVKVYDESGNQIAELKDQLIYSDSAVPPGETHEDTPTKGGVVLKDRFSAKPTTAKVEIKRTE